MYQSQASLLVAALADLGLYEARHDVDERARGEVLAGAGFLLVGVLFEQALVEIAEALFLGGEPVELVDARDDFLEVLRLVDARGGAGVDLLNTAGGVGAEALEQLFVVFLEGEAPVLREHVPAVGDGDGLLGTGFFGHFQK